MSIDLILKAEAGEIEEGTPEHLELARFVFQTGLYHSTGSWQRFLEASVDTFGPEAIVTTSPERPRLFSLRWQDEDGDTWAWKALLSRSDRAWFRNRYREALAQGPTFVRLDEAGEEYEISAREAVVSEWFADNEGR